MSNKRKRLKVISDSSCREFNFNVNAYLSALDKDDFSYEVSYGCGNWSIDGESGSNHFAYINYWIE